STVLPQDQDLHLFDHGALDVLDTYTPPKVPDPVDERTVLKYTPNRLLDFTNKPIGWKIDPVYDGFGRLDHIILPGAQAGLQLSYYDVSDPNVSCRGKLHTLTTTQDDVTLSYTYLGSLLQSTTWSGSISGKVSWMYDNDFRVTSESVEGS